MPFLKFSINLINFIVFFFVKVNLIPIRRRSFIQMVVCLMVKYMLNFLYNHINFIININLYKNFLYKLENWPKTVIFIYLNEKKSCVRKRKRRLILYILFIHCKNLRKYYFSELVGIGLNRSVCTIHFMVFFLLFITKWLVIPTCNNN